MVVTEMVLESPDDDNNNSRSLALEFAALRSGVDSGLGDDQQLLPSWRVSANSRRSDTRHLYVYHIHVVKPAFVHKLNDSSTLFLLGPCRM